MERRFRKFIPPNFVLFVSFVVIPTSLLYVAALADLDELQGNAVVAPALAGRFGAVVEDMAMVTVAADAVVFSARRISL